MPVHKTILKMTEVNTGALRGQSRRAITPGGDGVGWGGWWRRGPQCSDWNLLLQGPDGTKEGLPVRGKMHAKAEMNECALWPRSGTGMMLVKGCGGRTGWKVQLSVRLGSGGMLFGRQ